MAMHTSIESCMTRHFIRPGRRPAMSSAAALSSITPTIRVERIRPALEARSLTKRYGAVTALDLLDLAIMPGEVFCLLGANGAGKTTTLKSIMGIVTQRKGAVHYEGRELIGLIDVKSLEVRSIRIDNANIAPAVNYGMKGDSSSIGRPNSVSSAVSTYGMRYVMQVCPIDIHHVNIALSPVDSGEN
jgi:ABC-type glutathione transport system ATPase component